VRGTTNGSVHKSPGTFPSPTPELDAGEEGWELF
jgi:hypothetical protein